MSQQIIDAVMESAKSWGDAFNRGDALGCAQAYSENAVMHAEPLVKVTGREKIQEFWQSMVDDGLSDVRYLDPKITVVSDSVAELTSPWKMNKAGGIIHLERWELESDGKWRLTYDHFEVLESQ